MKEKEKPEITKYKTLQQIVDQLEWCNYECEAGMLKMNTAFIALKKMALEAEKPEEDAKVFLEVNLIDELESLARDVWDSFGNGFSVEAVYKIKSFAGYDNAKKGIDDAQAIVNLTSDLRYISGIVERGEDRTLGDKERITDAVLSYVKKLEKQCAERGNKWISVKDRLPEYNTYVLCAHGKATPFIGVFDSRGCFDMLNLLRDPTHWQPLPEAPK